MTLDELRDEFDWMFEFMGRMAERIRDDKNVHNLADYVHKIEDENDRLRELVRQMYPKAKAFLQMGVQLGCNDTLSYDWYLQLYELGVEVET